MTNICTFVSICMQDASTDSRCDRDDREIEIVFYPGLFSRCSTLPSRKTSLTCNPSFHCDECALYFILKLYGYASVGIHCSHNVRRVDCQFSARPAIVLLERFMVKSWVKPISPNILIAKIKKYRYSTSFRSIRSFKRKGCSYLKEMRSSSRKMRVIPDSKNDQWRSERDDCRVH